MINFPIAGPNKIPCLPVPEAKYKLPKSDFGNLYLASGTGRQGILLGPAMGKLILDNLMSKKTEIPIEPFSHKRFA